MTYPPNKVIWPSKNWGQGPVFRKSRDFTGHFRVSQFSLYLKNGEDLSCQTSQSLFFSFCYLENMSKHRLSKSSGWHFHKWLFGPEKFSGLLRNGPHAPVQRMDSAIRRINYYPVDKSLRDQLRYPMDSNLSRGGYRVIHLLNSWGQMSS